MQRAELVSLMTDIGRHCVPTTRGRSSNASGFKALSQLHKVPKQDLTSSIDHALST
jgi:hypothetical protein